jgi:hypothetical protein
MSITILQNPTPITLSNSDLIWEVTSSFVTSSQFQYVCSLQDGCGNVLTTVQQRPNQNGKGVFNLGRIIKQYLDYDEYALDIGKGLGGSLFNKNTETAKFFKVAFGERYGTSPSSSTNVYNGIVNNITGSPSNTGSISSYYFINGVLDRNYGQWNWDTSSYFKMETTPNNSSSFSYNVGLTSSPREFYIQDTDFHSVSLLNGNLNSSTSSAQDITWAVYRFYSGSTQTDIYDEPNINVVNNNLWGGPRLNQSQSFSQVNSINTCSNITGSQTSGSLLIHVGIGTGNLKAKNPAIPIGDWDRYTVTFYTQNSSSLNTFNTGGIWDQFTFIRKNSYCGYEPIRFAWINEFGVWDYWNFTLATDKVTNLEIGTSRKNFVDYSTSTNIVNYDKKRPGNVKYFTNINQLFTVNSDWLTQQQADWLENLFWSSQVYIQDGSSWIPIIIQNTSFVSKTNPRTQKLFNYSVTYSISNDKRSR